MPESEGSSIEPAFTVLSDGVLELASSFNLAAGMAKFERLARDIALVEPTPKPPPPPPSAAEIAELLELAETHLRELEIKSDPRHAARGPIPADSKLEAAYAEGRAMVLDGRLEQIRQWTALAKFGSREPGPDRGFSPLSRYDLVVTSTTRKDRAYLHVIVPANGLATGPGSRGTHQAWVDGERWLNLSDSLEPGREYLPFKTNGHESLHRQWARAEVIESLVMIATEYRQRTGVPLGVGDLSHVTGGRIKDHWTHQEGVDADLYLLDPAVTDDDGRPRVWWCHFKRGVSTWTSKAKGKGEREPLLNPDDALSRTATSERLETLAQIVVPIDAIAYFVHNDPIVLAPFDERADDRRPGRRFLHAENRGYWPTHADHVHLRWARGKLPVDVTPRP